MATKDTKQNTLSYKDSGIQLDTNPQNIGYWVKRGILEAVKIGTEKRPRITIRSVIILLAAESAKITTRQQEIQLQIVALQELFESASGASRASDTSNTDEEKYLDDNDEEFADEYPNVEHIGEGSSLMYEGSI